MICIPITATTMRNALLDISKAEKLADIIELRIDYIKDLDLKKLLSKPKKPVIVTCRKRAEAGRFKGTEMERLSLLKQAILLNADYVDIELSVGRKTIKQLIKNKRKTKIIISTHNFRCTDKNLAKALDKSIKLNADIVKIAAKANYIYDNIKMFELIKIAKNKNKPIIALCMGEKGRLSRILAPMFGSYLTFASLSKGKESASGQITVKQLKKIWQDMGV